MTENVNETGEPTEEAVEASSRPLPEVDSIRGLVERFENATFELRQYASSDVTYHAIGVPVSDWLAFAMAAKEAGFDLFVDLAGVDHFSDAPRFEVALNLVSMNESQRIIVSTRVSYEDPVVPSITDVFVGANFYEREAYDLIGIDFPGHPDLTRILMPDDWDGHPLRKDYDIGAVPVEFKSGSVDL